MEEMPLYGHHYAANFRDPRPHLDSLTADTHHCGTNSLESVVAEFESSEEGYRVPTTEQVVDSPEIWESPAVPLVAYGARFTTTATVAMSPY